MRFIITLFEGYNDKGEKFDKEIFVTKDLSNIHIYIRDIELKKVGGIKIEIYSRQKLEELSDF